ncbi:MAG TPA: CNNM domain-containing protein [Gemmatales bacterium]|nr:CNNM domain-containing protein [Gemmatales bacterium]
MPKRLPLFYPEYIACRAALFLRFISRLFRPVVWFLDRTTDLLVWLFRIPERTEPDISQEDIKSMVEVGTKTGIVDPEEKAIIERLFHLGDQNLSAVMTPRKEIVDSGAA